MTLAERRDVLAGVLDTLIPPGDGFPGAGAVALDHVLALAAASAGLEVLLSRGLQQAEAEARATRGAAFTALNADDREQVLQAVERSHPECFEALVRHTYDGYYAHPTVVACLGLDPGPLHPRGHRIDPVESPDLARVTARGPLYRRA